MSKLIYRKGSKAKLDSDVRSRLEKFLERVDDLKHQHNVTAKTDVIVRFDPKDIRLSSSAYALPGYVVDVFLWDVMAVSLVKFGVEGLTAYIKCEKDIRAMLREKYPDLKQYVEPEREPFDLDEFFKSLSKDK